MESSNGSKVTADKVVRVLLVEDNPGDARLMRELLSEAGQFQFAFHHADRLSVGIERLDQGDIDVLLLDLTLPDSQGFQTFERARDASPLTPIIVLSGLDDEALAIRTVQEGCQDYLVKGRVEASQLARSIRYAIERKHAADALLQERKLLRTMIDNLPDYIYVKDLSSRFRLTNQALANVLGLPSPDDVVGKWDFDFFPANEAAQYLADEQGILGKGEPLINHEEPFMTPSGERRWVLTTKMPLRSPTGAVTGLVGITRDITLHKQAEEQLQRATIAAETATRAKSEFLANMSHEIRTPMNGIIGMAELALQTDLSPEQREYLGMVRSSAESLLALLNDVLDFSKIEAGKLDLEEAPFGLRDMMGDLVHTLGRQADRKGIELVCHILPEVPDGLLGDPNRLGQVVVNLAANALKFTEHGEVVVTVEKEWQDETNVGLHVCVSDTGIGIPAEKQEIIFDPFSQADTSTTRKYGGTGLGLSIAGQIVRMMGGRLWLKSEVGKGSDFHFTARFRLADELPARVDAPSGSLAGLRVLIVDDNDTNRRLLEEVMGLWRMDTLSASGGAEALDALHHAQREGRSFRLVVSDVNMPGMDGFTLARQVRKDPALAGTPLILLTSADRLGDRVRSKQAGISARLLKPIKQSDLLRAVSRALGVKPVLSGSDETSPEAGGRIPPLRILLAEDNAVNQRMAVRSLEKRGHTVTVANDGVEALAAIRREHPDLVLMDVQMPLMDGFEATKAIREQERGTGVHLPIVAMTASAMKGDRERCLDAGMDAYISKPLHLPEFFRVIEGLIPASRLEGGRAAPVARHVFDRAAALCRTDDDLPLLKELIGLFFCELPNQVAEIEGAIEAGNGEALQRSAHALKGMTASLAAGSATEAALILEQIGRSDDLSKAPEAFEELQREICLLTGALNQVE